MRLEGSKFVLETGSADGERTVRIRRNEGGTLSSTLRVMPEELQELSDLIFTAMTGSVHGWWSPAEEQ